MKYLEIKTISKGSFPCKRISYLIYFYGFVAALFLAFNSTEVDAQNNIHGILSPKDGAIVNAAEGVKIQYDFRNDDKAQHVHLFLDDTQIAMGHKAFGEIMASPLTAGKRQICLSPVNANHTPIGQRSCITVIAE
ncbi:MAG: hypothetical protein FJX39_07040 [Alphaproteobacteria bacterium]|nr:hypothetical protein [Alphaproteobacteria bacterium]